MDSFVVGSSMWSTTSCYVLLTSSTTEHAELAPHRYFHEVFRLAALLYLNMLIELPPRSLPNVLLVRKMLSLVSLLFVSGGAPTNPFFPIDGAHRRGRTSGSLLLALEPIHPPSQLYSARLSSFANYGSRKVCRSSLLFSRLELSFFRRFTGVRPSSTHT
jgi:hypothetical protein